MHNISKNLIKSIICCFLFFVFSITAYSYQFEGFKFNDNTLELIHISDVHLDSKTKGSSKRMFGYSEALLNDAVSQVNAMKQTDITVFSGDIINHSDSGELSKFLNITNNLKTPWLYAPGNHDIGILGGISKPKFASMIIGAKNNVLAACLMNHIPHRLYYSYSPKRNFLIICLDGVIDNKITANAYFPREELCWLENQLKSNPGKKIIIVQHYPVVEPFESSSHKVLNVNEYLNIIDKYNNVIAVLSGHYHSSKITQRKNVLHISTPALVEYPHSFREIKITNLKDGAKFEIKLIETNLKNIQKISKSRLSNTARKKGQTQDKNTEIIIKTQR